MMLIGKIMGLIVLGAILTMPIYVFIGSLLAPFKIKEWFIFIACALIAYAVMASLIFGETDDSIGVDCRKERINDC